MKIGNISSYRQSFGVKLGPLSQKKIEEIKNNILNENGENSKEYKKICNDISLIKSIRPNDKLIYDMSYSTTKTFVMLKSNNPEDKMILLAIWPSDGLFSSERIHRLAEALKKLQ